MKGEMYLVVSEAVEHLERRLGEKGAWVKYVWRKRLSES